MEKFIEWFEENQRDFPWRKKRTPYGVLISEVMLQQTRASFVVPHFIRWMRTFPDIETLALAPLSAVIKSWEGLGYYSRARNLHRCAKEILERFSGGIPSSEKELLSLPGIGLYTAHAILSFGFQKPFSPVDANVERVITRLFSIEESVEKQSVKKKIREKALSLLGTKSPWLVAEGLIELGAKVCGKTPKCSLCPLEKNCLGKEKAGYLPIKKMREKTIFLKRICLLLEAEGFLLVEKPKKDGVMADLYEFPYVAMEKGFWPLQRIESFIEKNFSLKLRFLQRLSPVTHTFTKYRATLYPFRFAVEEKKPVKGCVWIERKKLEELPFSSGHRRVSRL